MAVLVGAPGAGKTTIGRALAAALGVGFCDTDREVERSAGKPVGDIFVDDGEAQFRRLEADAVAAALSEQDGVVALGGGAILDARTRALLVGHRVVWLQVDLPTAAKRVGLARDRPLLTMNPRAHLRELLAARAPLYAEVATDVIEASAQGPDEVVDRLRRAVAGGG